MVSETSRPVIEAISPVVAEHSEQTARRFSQHTSGDHPELLNGISNRGDQAEATQRVALARSVAACASALVATLHQEPEHLPSRISHQHASLGILREQHRIVHESLFGAITAPHALIAA